MIRLPADIGVEDLGQWLYGGVCMAEIDDKHVPAIFYQARRDDSGLHARVRLLTDGFSSTHTIDASRLCGHWPMLGSFNVMEYKAAFNVERIPQRQYRRTLHSRQLKFRVPKDWELSRINGAAPRNMMTLNNRTIKAIYEPVFPASFDEGLRWLADGWLSVAMNRRLIVAGDAAGKRMLYYRGRLAAYLQGDTAVPVTDPATAALLDRDTGGRYIWTAI